MSRIDIQHQQVRWHQSNVAILCFVPHVQDVSVSTLFLNGSVELFKRKYAVARIIVVLPEDELFCSIDVLFIA